MLDASEAFIKVKFNHCGFIPATVTIDDEKYGSFKVRVSANKPPFIVDYFDPVTGIDSLSNPLDVERFRKILEDEQSYISETALEDE